MKDAAEYLASIKARIVVHPRVVRWVVVRLLKRWDNAAHHPEVVTRPHHVHDGADIGTVRGMQTRSPWVSLRNVLRQTARRGRVQGMSATDPIRTIITPFLVHGICKNEAEALQMLAKDYVQRQVRRYGERVEHFRACYQTSVEQFAQQVMALCQGVGQLPALSHLDRQKQIVRAEDDLEEWQAAEQYLARWRAVEADLQHATTT